MTLWLRPPGAGIAQALVVASSPFLAIDVRQSSIALGGECELTRFKVALPGVGYSESGGWDGSGAASSGG